MDKKLEISLKIDGANPLSPCYQIKRLLQTHICENLSPGDRIPSERELAEQGGLARATIAKAINQLVSERVLVRIQGKGTFVAQSYKNHPESYFNYFVNNVKLKHDCTVCVICSYRESELDEKFMQGWQLLDEIESKLRFLFNASPFVVNYCQLEDPLAGCLKEIERIKPDGVILLPEGNPHAMCRPLIENLTALHIEVVVANGLIEGAPSAGVICDHRGGIGLLVDHLKELKHENITLVARTNPAFWVSERVEGFQAACARNKISITENNIKYYDLAARKPSFPVPEDYIALGRRAGRELFAHPSCSAIIAINDSIAVGLCQAAKEAGVRVPQDCSIVGFDDYYPFREYNLTTVRYPAKEIAENALGILLLKLHGRKTARVTRIMPELIKRETTGGSAECVSRSTVRL